MRASRAGVIVILTKTGFVEIVSRGKLIFINSVTILIYKRPSPPPATRERGRDPPRDQAERDHGLYFFDDARVLEDPFLVSTREVRDLLRTVPVLMDGVRGQERVSA